MRKQVIIFLGFLVMAAFEKRECDACRMIDFFPFADWTMLWPVYARETCVYLVMIGWAYVIHREERSWWSLMAFILVVGWYLNFALMANARWFTIYNYPFGYTAFAALIFSICIFLQVMNGLSRLRS